MLTACTGNGGAANSNGELYNPNNIPVSSSGSGASGGSASGSSGSSGGSSESFTAEDLLNAANSGDPGRIIELISVAPSGDESGETTTIVLSAADLGLPAGGTVTLTITGAISFDETKGAADDGTVTFIIPKVVTGKTVTIELSVKDETGFVIYYGKETGPVEGSGNLDITLHRQYRTHATADRTVLTATATSAELATITITGATETPQLMPSSSLLNTDPPVQDASDPETYTVSVGIPGGTAPVWFADDTSVSVTVKVGTEEHTIAFTLKNKYTVQVEYTANGGSITSSELSTPYMQGSSITFTEASGAVTSTQGNRGVAAFKYGSSIVLSKTAAAGATSVTINSTNFPGLASRTISLEAILNFEMTVTGGKGDYAAHAGTAADPYILTYYGADNTDETKITAAVTGGTYTGSITAHTDASGRLTITEGSSPVITINKTALAASDIPAAGLTYTVTVKDYKTGESAYVAANVYSEKLIYVKIPKPFGSKGTIDAVGNIVFSDRSVSAYTETLDGTQKAAAVAVIFDVASKKGVGLNITSGIAWCSASAQAYSVATYATSTSDGKANTDQIAALSDYNEMNYPAFWYCTSYSVPGFTSGWYLPAKNELSTLSTNRTTVEAAFSALGMTSPFTGTWASSSQWASDGQFVALFGWSVSRTNGRKTTEWNIPAVRVFN